MFSSHVFGERLNCLVYLSYSALFVLSCWFTGTFTVPDVLFFVFLFVCLFVCSFGLLLTSLCWHPHGQTGLQFKQFF